MQNATSDRTETVHRAFRGTSELVKRHHRQATALDILAAAGVVWLIFDSGCQIAKWWPLIFLALVAGATALRLRADRLRGHAERCRRVSLRAFACATEIDSLTASDLSISTPSAAEKMAKKLPAQSCHDYYEPTLSTGAKRLTELYAHSAFFSHRLLCVHGFVAAALAVMVVAGALILVYVLAVANPGQQLRLSILEALFSVVLVVLGLRYAKDAVNSFFSSVATGKIEAALLQKPKRAALDELIEEYDIERVTSPMIPTWLYRITRNRFGDLWAERRSSLSG